MPSVAVTATWPSTPVSQSCLAPYSTMYGAALTPQHDGWLACPVCVTFIATHQVCTANYMRPTDSSWTQTFTLESGNKVLLPYDAFKSLNPTAGEDEDLWK